MYGLGTIKRINAEAERVAKARQKLLDEHRERVSKDLERRKRAK